MAFYYCEDPDFWNQINHPSLAWTQEMTRISDIVAGAARMGDDDDEGPPMAQFLKLPPGGIIPKHSHDCYRVEVVIKGSFDVGNGRQMGPGDVMITAPGESYGPHVVGPEGAMTAEFVSDCTGKIVFADPEMASTGEAIAQHMAEFKEQVRSRST